MILSTTCARWLLVAALGLAGEQGSSVGASQASAAQRGQQIYGHVCIACHNAGKGENASFSLYPDVAIQNTIDQPTNISSAEGIRVVPGDPESSVLFITVVRTREPGYDGPFKAMPPLAINRVDPATEGILGAWIQGLTAGGQNP